MFRQVILDGGKYTFRFDDSTHKLTCDRYGEPWREFVGDKAVYLLFEQAYEAQQISAQADKPAATAAFQPRKGK